MLIPQASYSEMKSLIDANSFFVTAELLRNPYLRFQPCVVRSNGDGCIIAANKIAKALPDFKMWMPVFMQKELLELHNVIQFSPNFELYVDLSRRMMDIIDEFLRRLMKYSIDECFGYVPIGVDYRLWAMQLYEILLKELGIRTGVGVAPTLTLCKVANHIAKKFPVLNGCYVIDNEEKRIKALKWLLIADVWGIGMQLAMKLNEIKVYTAYDFTQIPDAWVQKHMGVVGLRMKFELLGVSCLQLKDLDKEKKEIGTAKQFGQDLDDFDTIREVTANYTIYVAQKLRNQYSLAKTINIFLATNPHSNRPQHNAGIDIRLPYPCSATGTLLKYATKGLEKVFKSGYKFRRVGVSLRNLVPDKGTQGNLFVPINEKLITSQKAVDFINFKYGIDKVTNATAGFNKNEWETRFDNRSPRFTTRLEEIETMR